MALRTLLFVVAWAGSVFAAERDKRDGDNAASARTNHAVALFGIGIPAGGDTGADSCDGTVVTPVPVGPTGQPLSITINGDNSEASGPDCPAQSPDPLWWEAFSLEKCGRVQISYCGTDPPQTPSYAILFDQCPCGERIRADSSGRFSGPCADENLWAVFDALPAGTYYLPVFSDEGVLIQGRGPYTITISAEGCLGVCCNPSASTCEEGVAEEDCAQIGDVWSPVGTCCEAECLPTDQEYAAGNVSLLSRVPLGALGAHQPRANDIWGYVSPSGREYAIVGLYSGTGFVDVTDPFNPIVIAVVPDSGSIWSDMAVYQEFAYNVNESGDGLQIIDLREIDNGIVTLLGAAEDVGVRTAHNLKINTDSGYAYLCGPNVASGGLVAVDLSNPTNPQFAGAWDDHYVHDTMVVSYHEGNFAGREIAYNFCGAAGLRVVDVTDKKNMHTIGSGIYPTLTYCHQGWLDPSRKWLFVDDELDELNNPMVSTTTTYVFDVSVPIFPTYRTSFTNEVCSTDHNLMVDGSYVYAANYSSGLRVFDASDPLNMHEVGFFDTHPEGNEFGFDGAWGVFTQLPSGVVLVSDIQRGLFVLNFDCNDNGIPDVQELALDTTSDCDGNGRLDVCEYLKPADLNRDRRIDPADEAAFVSCLSGPFALNQETATVSSYLAPCCVHADGDTDGDVDLRDLWMLRNAAQR